MTNGESAKERVRNKYDSCAASYSGHYKDPAAVAERQVRLVRSWGPRLRPSARILELGCANGFVTEALAQAGFRVTGVDISPAMIREARTRLDRAGLPARFFVADVDEFRPSESFDAVLAIMGDFFHYSRDPVRVLEGLARISTTKVIVDVNPRRNSVGDALAAMREAGLRKVRWRPFFVPSRVRLPKTVIAALSALERVPALRGLPLHWKFRVVLLGQR